MSSKLAKQLGGADGIQTNLELAGMGGCIIEVQEDGGQGGFRLVLLDQTLPFVDKEVARAEIRRDSGWLDACIAAMITISKWPSAILVPRYVDGAFPGRIITAVRQGSAKWARNQ